MARGVTAKETNYLQIRAPLFQEGDLLVFEGCFFLDPEQSLGFTHSASSGQAHSTPLRQAWWEAQYQWQNADCGMQNLENEIYNSVFWGNDPHFLNLSVWPSRLVKGGRRRGTI
jgi:hypothetical protein